MPSPTPPRAILLLALAIVVQAAQAAPDPVKRKAGLWEIKNSVMGITGAQSSMQICIDEKTDDLQRQLSGQQAPGSQCQVTDTQRSGNKMTVKSVCKMGGTTATSTVTITGDFNSAYHGDIRVAYDPPMGGMKNAQMTMDAKWLGACKAGQKPGDLILPNGTVVNAQRAKPGAR